MTADPEYECTLRRSIPRQVTDWRGQYKILGDPLERWRDCRVVDISSAGAGLVLSDTNPEEAEGRNIIVAVHLRASVVNLSETKGGLRAGTQFVHLSPDETAYLQSLVDVGARW